MILLVDNGSSSIINLIEKIKFIDNKIRVIKNTDVNQVEKIKGMIEKVDYKRFRKDLSYKNYTVKWN